jgi:CheY-like chemotaxis protein
MSEMTRSTILLVDDNRTSLSLRKLMLQNHGHNVMASENALPALYSLRTELISLVISTTFLTE